MAAGDEEYVAFAGEPVNKDAESVVSTKRIQNPPAVLTAIGLEQIRLRSPSERYRGMGTQYPPRTYQPPSPPNRSISPAPSLTIAILPPTPTQRALIGSPSKPAYTIYA